MKLLERVLTLHILCVSYDMTNVYLYTQ